MKKRERTSLRENDTFCFNIIQFELRIEMGLGLALLMCNFIIKKKKERTYYIIKKMPHHCSIRNMDKII